MRAFSRHRLKPQKQFFVRRNPTTNQMAIYCLITVQKITYWDSNWITVKNKYEMEKMVKKVQADQGFRRWSGSIWEINWEVLPAMLDCTFLSPIALWCGFWSTFRWTLPLTVMHYISVLLLYCYALSYKGLDKEHTYEGSVQKGSDVTMDIKKH